MVMKVFIWRDVLADYTAGIAVAVAETKEEAIGCLVLAGYPEDRVWELTESRHPYGWAPPEPNEPIIHDLDDGPIGVCCHGGG